MATEATVRLELTVHPDDDDSCHSTSRKRIDSDAISNMTMWSKYEYQVQDDCSHDTVSSSEETRKGSAALSDASIQEAVPPKPKETFRFPSFKFNRFRVPGLRWPRNEDTAIHGELIEELSPENTLDRGDGTQRKESMDDKKPGIVTERRSSSDRLKRIRIRARRSLTTVLTTFACLGGQRFDDEDGEGSPYLSAKYERDLNAPRLEIIDLSSMDTVNNPVLVLDGFWALGICLPLVIVISLVREHSYCGRQQE